MAHLKSLRIFFISIQFLCVLKIGYGLRGENKDDSLKRLVRSVFLGDIPQRQIDLFSLNHENHTRMVDDFNHKKRRSLEIHCSPVLFPNLKGFCASTQELSRKCFNSDISESNDCTIGSDGSRWCCYHLSKERKTPTTKKVRSTRTAAPTTKKVGSTHTAAHPTPLREIHPVNQFAVLASTPVPPREPVTEQVKEELRPQRAAAIGDPCNSVNDCPDPGTTCFNGKCTCWMSQGFSAAQTWACSSDPKCEKLFPGHVCRPTSLCRGIPGQTGFCTPRLALRS
jgi:hypothetical protein